MSIYNCKESNSSNIPNEVYKSTVIKFLFLYLKIQSYGPKLRFEITED